MAEDGQTPHPVTRAAPQPEPTLAELLDPIAIEERLREARSRRALALAGRRAGDGAPASAGPVPAAPRDPPAATASGPVARVAFRRPAAYSLLGFLAGVAAAGAVAGGLLVAWPASAPEALPTAAVPSRPAAVPAAPSPVADAGWRQTPPQPLLAGLAFTGSAPPPRPARLTPVPPPPAMAPAAAPSKARAASAPGFAAAAPVLSQAATSGLLPMLSRSTAMLPYPLVQDDRAASPPRATPKLSRRTEGLVRQLTRAGQSALRDVARGDPGENLARTIRRASAIVQEMARPDKARRLAAPGRGGSKGKGGHGVRGGSKGKGGKGKGGRR